MRGSRFWRTCENVSEKFVRSDGLPPHGGANASAAGTAFTTWITAAESVQPGRSNDPGGNGPGHARHANPVLARDRVVTRQSPATSGIDTPVPPTPKVA